MYDYEINMINDNPLLNNLFNEVASKLNAERDSLETKMIAKEFRKMQKLEEIEEIKNNNNNDNN